MAELVWKWPNHKLTFLKSSKVPGWKKIKRHSPFYLVKRDNVCYFPMRWSSCSLLNLNLVKVYWPEEYWEIVDVVGVTIAAGGDGKVWKKLWGGGCSSQKGDLRSVRRLQEKEDLVKTGGTIIFLSKSVDKPWLSFPKLSSSWYWP